MKLATDMDIAPTASPSSRETLRDDLHKALSAAIPNHDQPHAATRKERQIAAAVLYAVLLRDPRPTVLLTRRTDHLHDHPGQISFPGGRIESEDETPQAAAIRESEEEVGLPPESLEVIGCMPQYQTATGFSITPVLALADPPDNLILDTFEVAEIIEPPLEFLIDINNIRRYQMLYKNKQHTCYQLQYQQYCIWGAIAGIIRSLAMGWEAVQER